MKFTRYTVLGITVTNYVTRVVNVVTVFCTKSAKIYTCMHVVFKCQVWKNTTVELPIKLAILGYAESLLTNQYRAFLINYGSHRAVCTSISFHNYKKRPLLNPLVSNATILQNPILTFPPESSKPLCICCFDWFNYALSGEANTVLQPLQYLVSSHKTNSSYPAPHYYMISFSHEEC